MNEFIAVMLTVIVVALVVGVFYWAVGALPFIPVPMAQIMRVFIVVGGCLWLIGALFGHGRIPSITVH